MKADWFRRGACLAGLALVLNLLPADANHLGPSDHHAVHLVGVAYHPYPDDQGDPLGVPFRGRDWMAQLHDAEEPPVALWDGIRRLDGIPQGEGGGPQVETLAAYRAAYASRVAADANITLRLAGSVGETEPGRSVVQLHLDATRRGEAPAPPRLVRAVLVEDSILVGPPGSALRFVARAAPTGHPWPGDETESSSELRWNLDPSWDTAHLGVVVFVQESDSSFNETRPGEIVQAAFWTQGQEGPTIQYSKAVLAEFLSATWCDACAVAEKAFDELLRQYGPGEAEPDPSSYLRPPAPWAWGVSAIAGAAAAAAFRPRRPGPSGPGPEEARRGA